MSLGLDDSFLQQKFGGKDIQASLRVNYYPKCPQPDLTLGLSSHSDPGGLTVLLADDHVTGLQVNNGGKWVTVQPVPGAFVVNVADQIQVRSLEHVSILFLFKRKMDEDTFSAEYPFISKHCQTQLKLVSL